ncbi:MAG: SMI1/KNR4 family protein [Pseudomonadota bacterium]
MKSPSQLTSATERQGSQADVPRLSVSVASMIFLVRAPGIDDVTAVTACSRPIAGIGPIEIKNIAEVSLLPSIQRDYIEYIKSVGPFECLTQEDAEPGYVVLWPFDEIVKNNSDIEIEMYAPGFVAFGGNGGGELLVFDATGAVFMLPMIGMEPDCAIRIAEDFQELVSRLEI